MVDPIQLMSDTRAVLGAAVAMLGLTFIRYGISRKTPAVIWLSLSSSYYGLGQLAMRLIELLLSVSNPLNGWMGIIIGLPPLAGFVAGTIALIVRQHSGWLPFLVTLLGLPAAFLAWRGWHGAAPYQWQSLVALVFVSLSAWALLNGSIRERPGRLGLPMVLLLYPAALLYCHLVGSPVQDFRRLAIVAVSLKFLYLMTLILQDDARLLLSELRSKREAQTALRLLADSLEEKVEERTRQLQALNQGLRSFAGMVSHDLRGPVRNIGGLASMARESLHDKDIEGTEAALVRIETEALRAGDMTTDLLALASAEQGNIHLEWVDMQVLCNTVIDTLSMQYPAAPSVVEVHQLPTVFADRDLMSHVLTNLLSNALKFGSSREDLKVTVEASRIDQTWRFEVTDNGAGFDPAKADQLFKPFARLGRCDVPGTGLGLLVVHRVVQAHGGRVGASSCAGEGTTFWWTLVDMDDASARCFATST